MRALPALLALGLLASCLEPPTRPLSEPPDEVGATTPCDPFAPGACAAGGACQPSREGTFACLEPGTAGDHAACSDADRCLPGLICTRPPHGPVSVCLSLCRDDADCPQEPGPQLCELALPGKPGPALCHRMRRCDPWAAPLPCEPNEKCSLARLPGEFVCLPAGSRGDYEPCERESECAPGFACVRYDEGPARCAALCADDADCPQAGGPELCVRRNQPERQPVLCERVRTCAPGSSECPAGQSCYPSAPPASATGWREGYCRASGSKLAGALCSSLSDCAPGLACLSPTPGEPGQCRPMCTLDPTGPLPCVAGGYCVPITAHYWACI